jgi:hypothetical protein
VGVTRHTAAALSIIVISHLILSHHPGHLSLSVPSSNPQTMCRHSKSINCDCCAPLPTTNWSLTKLFRRSSSQERASIFYNSTSSRCAHLGALEQDALIWKMVRDRLGAYYSPPNCPAPRVDHSVIQYSTCLIIMFIMMLPNLVRRKRGLGSRSRDYFITSPVSG